MKTNNYWCNIGEELLREICRFQNKLNEIKEQYQEFVYPINILEFKIGTAIANQKNISLNYQQWCKYHLDNKAIIWQVLNNAGEQLTVGDTTNFGKIESFEIVNGLLQVDVEERFEILRSVDEVHPVKTFKTEDGYEIENNYLVYLVYPDLTIAVDNLDIVRFTDLKNTKEFKEKKNAENYCDLNKKRFSKQDILNAQPDDGKQMQHRITNNMVIDMNKLGI